jgi:hypothetical protein
VGRITPVGVNQFALRGYINFIYVCVCLENDVSDGCFNLVRFHFIVKSGK